MDVFEKCGTPAETWPAIMRKDLEFIYKQAQENHPGWEDNQNPNFRQCVIEGLQLALTEASEARTEKCVIKGLARYMASFADGHFTIAFRETEPTHWSGIWLAREDDHYVVRDRADTWTTPLPKIGDILLYCDGRPVDSVMEEDVLRAYFYDPNSSFPKSWLASKLLINQKYRSCVFRTREGEQTFTLDWQTFNPKSHHPRVKMMEQVNPYSVQQHDSVYWIRLSSFQPKEQEMKRFRMMLKELKAIEGPATVIFDLRGNGGGNSALGIETLKALYGEDRFLTPTRVLRRVSPDNYRWITHNILPHLKGHFGEDSEYYAIYDSMAKKMAASLASGDSLVEEEAESSQEQAEPENRPAIDYSALAKPIIITDESCGSACLDFIDVIKTLPGHLHLGKETAGDSVYMDVRPKNLPSGLGTLIIPQKVYRHRLRGNNESYKPDRPFFGNIYDDEAVETWVRDLLTEEQPGAVHKGGNRP